MFVFKMRLYMRKLLALGGILIVLWVVISFMSTMDVKQEIRPKKNNILSLENKIDQLESLMDQEFMESRQLLKKVKNHLKKNEEKYIDSNRQNNLVVESNEISQDGQEMEPVSNTGPILPVLVIACDRVTVRRCLDNLVRFRPSKETFPIIVSQDCGHNATYQVIKSFVDADPSISVIKQPDLSEIRLEKSKVKFRGYYKIARHYKFALNHVFRTLAFEAVIIVEDDLDISPDFFEYFLGTYPLLLKDPSLWCISAWNDNGKREVIDMSRPELLHRTDFFPGLGWTMRRHTWLTLEPKWPQAFFDDWLRSPENTDNKACIRPEISRTYSFGKVGVSKGLFFDLHLRHMQLNMEYVEFTKLNLTYLLKENYDPWLKSTVYGASSASAESALRSGGPARVPYRSAREYQRAARKMGLMDDFRSGIPRTAYKGIVTCYVNGHRVYIAPDFTWVKYDPTWG